MMMHSGCCMLFSCIVWFEITFQNDLNLHSKIWVEIRKRKRKGSLLSFYLACWPFPPASPARPLSRARSALAHLPRRSFARPSRMPAQALCHASSLHPTDSAGPPIRALLPRAVTSDSGASTPRCRVAQVPAAL